MPFTKPLPHWEAPGIEPPTSLRQNGWKAGIKPPDEYFNYLQNKAYEALKELQEYAVHKDEMDLSGVATKEDLNVVKENLTTHLADKVKHISSTERTNWNGKEDKSNKNIPGGYAGLDANGKLAPSVIVDGYEKIYEIKTTQQAYSTELNFPAEYKEFRVEMRNIVIGTETHFRAQINRNSTLRQHTQNIIRDGSISQFNSDNLYYLAVLNGSSIYSTNFIGELIVNIMRGKDSFFAHFETDGYFGNFQNGESINTATARQFNHGYGRWDHKSVLSTLTITSIIQANPTGIIEVWGRK